jgi:hypothetical protein
LTYTALFIIWILPLMYRKSYDNPCLLNGLDCSPISCSDDHSFIQSVVLWQVHMLSQIEFSTECNLVLPLSISCILYFPINHPLPAYIIRTFQHNLYLSSIKCFRRQALHKMWPIQLAFLLFIVRRIFLSTLTLVNTTSLFIWLVPLIFCILITLKQCTENT